MPMALNSKPLYIWNPHSYFVFILGPCFSTGLCSAFTFYLHVKCLLAVAAAVLPFFNMAQVKWINHQRPSWPVPGTILSQVAGRFQLFVLGMQQFDNQAIPKGSTKRCPWQLECSPEKSRVVQHLKVFQICQMSYSKWFYKYVKIFETQNPVWMSCSFSLLCLLDLFELLALLDMGLCRFQSQNLARSKWKPPHWGPCSKA